MARKRKEQEIQEDVSNPLHKIRKNKAHLFKPRNNSQKRFIESIQKNNIVFNIGTAGTGKTYCCVAYAIETVTDKRNKYRKMILVRPSVAACDEELGFLPGSKEEKLDPYMQPIYDVLFEYGITKQDVKKLLEDGVLEIVPLAYMRGRSLNNCFIKDTIITMGDGSSKFVQDVEVGDNVLSFNSDKNILEKKEVTKTISKYDYDMVNLKFNRGLDFSGSSNHELFVIDNESKDIIKKQTKDINCGDYVLTPRKINRNKDELSNLTPEQATLISIIICDGHLTKKASSVCVNVSRKDEDYFRRNITLGLEGFEKENPYLSESINHGRNSINFRHNDAKFVEFLSNKYEIPLGKKTYHVKVPHDIYVSSDECKKSFLRAAFDCEGWVNVSNTTLRISFHSASKRFAYDIMSLLKYFGIQSSVVKREKITIRNKVHSVGYMLTMVSINAMKFRDMIGFGMDRKQELAESLNNMTERWGYCPVPLLLEKDNILRDVNKKLGYSIDRKKPCSISTFDFIKDKLNNKLINVGENFDALKVVDKECFYKKTAVYDFEVCDNHSLISNMIVSSNCFVVVEEAQNMSSEQMEMLLTRIGHDSKFVITGDITQRDIKKATGIEEACRLFKDSKSIDFIFFENSETLRDPIVKEIVEKYALLRKSK